MAFAYTNHPKINDMSTTEQMKHRALLVALGLVYYMRLDTSYRERFVDEIDRNNFSVKFQEAFTEDVSTWLANKYTFSVDFSYFVSR